jgi:ubiquinone/menaquinone biosynthesis C-methylase UbiE
MKKGANRPQAAGRRRITRRTPAISRLPQALDISSIVLSSQDIERILDGWILERHPIGSAPWKAIEAHERRKMLGKLTKFKLRGVLPWLPHFARYRNKDFIVRQYSKTWTEQPWPSLREPLTPRMRTAATWGDEGMVVRRGGLTRLSIEMLARYIEATRPKSVLEVGSGSGRNLLLLATRFPDVSFTGLELTQAGVDRANSEFASDRKDPDMAAYAPWMVSGSGKSGSVVCIQGSAAAMPFADSSFDLVFSHAALEQMENVRDAALREIARVARSNIFMVEPFGNFNEDGFRPLAIRAKNYLTLRFEDIRNAGIEPEFSWAEWPRKITAGYGLVVGQKRMPGKSV